MFLITTKLDKKVNKKDILFLGNWCLNQNERDKYLKQGYQIIESKWEDPFFMAKESKNIRYIYEKLISSLTQELNHYHSINWSERAWRISIGLWLQKLIFIIANRWKSIEDAKNNYSITNTFIKFTDPNLLYTNSREDLSLKCKEDYWNKILFDYIIFYRNDIDYEKIKIIGDYKHKIKSKENLQNISYKRHLKRIFQNKIILNFIRLLKRNDAICIMNSYLSLDETLKIKLSNSTLPIPDYTKKYENIDKNRDLGFRNKWAINIKSESPLEKFIYHLIPHVLPKIYLEDFKNIYAIAEKSPLPKNPSFIITAISHWDNEVFKLWSSIQIQKQAKFIVIQHGGEYRTPLFNLQEEHERKISDVMFEWGINNSIANPKSIPVPIVKKKDFGVWNNKGAIVIICHYLSLNKYMSDMQPNTLFGGKCLKYYHHIQLLIELLSSRISKNISLKLIPNDEIYSKKLIAFIRKNDIKVFNNFSINSILRNSSLGIYTYLGTPFLESMSLDRPSLLLNLEDIYAFNPLLEIYFKKLMEIGILHKSQFSLVEHLKKIENNIDYWWNSDQVKICKKEFCDIFANNPDDIIFSINENLKSLN